MPCDKYDRWREAEKEAMKAESAFRLARKHGWPQAPNAEEEALNLRAHADRLFDEAMKEMDGQVSDALNKPLRKPY